MRKFLNNMRNPVVIFSIFSYASSLMWLIMDLFPRLIRNLFFKLVFKQFGRRTMIDYKCYVRYPWRVKIGNNVSINRGCELYSSIRSEHGYIVLENNVVLGPKVTIFAAGHDYTSIELPDTSAPVVICQYAWIGGNTTILPGVVIGEGAVVGAGSIVTKSIPPYTIAVGNPARVIKNRVLGTLDK